MCSLSLYDDESIFYGFMAVVELNLAKMRRSVATHIYLYRDILMKMSVKWLGVEVARMALRIRIYCRLLANRVITLG